MIPLERNFDLDHAQSEIVRVINELQLKYELTVVGRQVFAARCELYDSARRLVASGLGKGDEKSAIVGSLFESVEHYLSESQSIGSVSRKYMPSRDLTEQGAHLFTYTLESAIRDSHDGDMLCAEHRSLHSDIENVFYPVGLFMPSYVDMMCQDRSLSQKDTYSYHRLGEYSSNTGIAVGMNKTEAVLHGLLEASERDALSTFLFEVFVKRDERVLRKVDIQSLPQRLRLLADRVAEECSSPDVLIYELPSRFGIPAFCSWTNQPIFGVRQPGFGCSPSAEHAVERSLFELAQGWLSMKLIHDECVVEKLQCKRVSNLQSYPSLLRCLEFDLASIEDRFGFNLVKFRGSEAITSQEPAGYLQHALSAVSSCGGRAYSIDFAIPIETNVKATHTFITKSDRFMTVLGGRVPMPSPR